METDDGAVGGGGLGGVHEGKGWYSLNLREICGVEEDHAAVGALWLWILGVETDFDNRVGDCSARTEAPYPKPDNPSATVRHPPKRQYQLVV